MRCSIRPAAIALSLTLSLWATATALALAPSGVESSSAWWSLRPLSSSPVPGVKAAAWPRNPIDRFILAKLESRGLKPSNPADRRTLLRRVTYDLIGLPPTAKELAAFLADRRSDAYERVVDRLLASPRYGERWGRHWLDVAHYADTHGYDKDKRRDNAWRYRDYVIQAFNDDKPYSRFVQEQLAGDVLAPNDANGVIATGFITAGPWDFVGNVELAEGTVEKEKTRLLDRDDMVSSVITTFDSVTIHCARCHDHKFDPIPQRDYYRLQAVFAGVQRGDRILGERELLEGRRDKIRAQQTEDEKLLDGITTPETIQIDRELAAARGQLSLLPPLQGTASPSNGYHSAISAAPDEVKWVQIDLGAPTRIDEIRLIPARPTDFADTPGFGFPVRMRIELSNEPSFAAPLMLEDRTSRDIPNPALESYLVKPANDAPRTGRYVRITATRLWKRTGDYVFALAEAEAISGGKNVALHAKITALDSIEAGRWSMGALVDGFDSRIDITIATTAKDEEARRELGARIPWLIANRRRVAMATLAPAVITQMERSGQELERIRRRLEECGPAQITYAVIPKAARQIRVLARGDVEQGGQVVQAGSLSCLPDLDSDFRVPDAAPEGERRAALARWITSPKNVLTWRSIVNRVWHFHFGKGIVDTPNDFGRNGGRPSHAELLNWLAAWFRDNGQSIKALHRMILLSATYRQSSSGNSASAFIDADDRLLWRMNRQRLDAESIRDSVLAVSGSLDLTMGGPGFELFRFKDDHSPIYDHSAIDKINDPRTWRRTVYAFSVRSVQNPFLECLDCADPNINTPVRNTTITALQALALLNDPFVIKQAEILAGRVRLEAAASESLGGAAIRLILGRPAGKEEMARSDSFVRKHGLATLCRLLLNANEFVFVD